MWSVTNYTLKKKDLFNNNLVVKIENEDNEHLIKSVELFVFPGKLKDLIPFSDPKDKIEEKKSYSTIIKHSCSGIMLAIKLKNGENMSYVYNILKKMNDNYIDKAKEKDRIEPRDYGILGPDFFEYTPILYNLDIESDIYVRGVYVRGDIVYSQHKNIQLTFEELAKHNLIDKELFMQVYEDFAKKINQCF